MPKFISIKSKKKLKNIIIVKTTFGNTVRCTDSVTLNIQIQGLEIKADFIILPREIDNHDDDDDAADNEVTQRLVFGKPILHKQLRSKVIASEVAHHKSPHRISRIL